MALEKLRAAFGAVLPPGGHGDRLARPPELLNHRPRSVRLAPDVRIGLGVSYVLAADVVQAR